MKQARIFESQQDFDAANELYVRIKENYTESIESQKRLMRKVVTQVIVTNQLSLEID